MSPTDRAALRAWAESHAPAGSTQARQVIDLLAEREKLQKFKDYVHGRLDAAGVQTDPDSVHKAEGCRIGGRLDIVLGALARLEKLESDPNYQYAGSWPINRKAIECRNEEIDQFLDLINLIMKTAEFVGGCGQKYEKLVAHIRELTIKAKGEAS